MAKKKVECVFKSLGTHIEYNDQLIGEGGMKRVYFTPDKKHVVAFFKTENPANEGRMQDIILKYNPCVDPQFGNYWADLYSWPLDMVKSKDGLGIVAPTYPKHFFFENGEFHKGKEKEGKWFASAKLRRMLDPSERGTWIDYIKICILISRAVRKMHNSGLAHSDLSYKNVLIDPKGGHAMLIDLDGLVVPQMHPPDVLGTPDFIAPEVYATLHLDNTDPKRKLPSRYTDLHALPVLIYMYLLYRHPLRGGKVHSLEAEEDEMLMMGTKAIFIEHSTDKSNRPKEKDPAYMPWVDVDKLPYNVTGPYLSTLFERSFIDGLHNPTKRPLAEEWENALIKTTDLLQPCGNTNCQQKWFVYDNSTQPQCPFCGWKYKGTLPILNLYSAIKAGNYAPDNHRLIVYNNQYLYPWHVNKRIFPDEKLKVRQPNLYKPVGYFSYYNGSWLLVNQNIPGLKDITENKSIPIGSTIELVEGKKILLSPEEGGRVLLVQTLKV